MRERLGVGNHPAPINPLNIINIINVGNSQPHVQNFLINIIKKKKVSDLNNSLKFLFLS